MVNFNRLLSLFPRPTLPEEGNFSHEDSADPHDGFGDDFGNENRTKYPAV